MNSANSPKRISSSELLFQALPSLGEPHFRGAVLTSSVCLATEIAERLDAEPLLGNCVSSILEGEIAENRAARQGSAEAIHSEANQQ